MVDGHQREWWLKTVIPPVNQRDTAKAELAKLAQTAMIRNVVFPLDIGWDAME